MKKFYVYEVYRSRAYSIDEIGTFTQVHTEEKLPHYETTYYSEHYRLQGRFSAHFYNDLVGEMRITANGEIRETNDLFIAEPRFSVLEVATMLDLTKQRILALITNKQLNATRRANIWLLAGQDILAFSLLERPAHRPKPVTQTP